MKELKEGTLNNVMTDECNVHNLIFLTFNLSYSHYVTTSLKSLFIHLYYIIL
jgi:hypothetical protein